MRAEFKEENRRSPLPNPFMKQEKQQEAGTKRRGQVKSRILQSVASILFVIAVTPALCRAQAEIDPDHFDSPNTVAMDAKSATSNQEPSQAYGSFFLPFDVRCAGVVLKSGQYSLSIQQSGSRNVVTLTRMVKGIPAQALKVSATPRLSAREPKWDGGASRRPAKDVGGR